MLRIVNLATFPTPVTLSVGTMTRTRLLEGLRKAGVELNESATRLLEHSVFDRPEPESLTVLDRSVSELGLREGATLAQIFQAADDRGLRPCPPTTGPYLRLALRSQETAPDAIMSNGRAPSGSLTVASLALQSDADFPKGFYLRVIDGRPWLRGYRCDEEFIWNPLDRFVFGLIG
jgi:hypothetical protein